jgi:hypothetical protein
MIRGRRRRHLVSMYFFVMATEVVLASELAPTNIAPEQVRILLLVSFDMRLEVMLTRRG